MMSCRHLNHGSAIIGNGKARLNTTGLMTSALVAFTPKPTTTKLDTIVTTFSPKAGYESQ
jgi:hypothetical protein